METHCKKLVQPYFDYVRLGIKTFELRKNDCDYQNGDILVLQEYEKREYETRTLWEQKGKKLETGIYTGREITTQIRYVLSDYDGIQDGYVILGIEVLEK